MRAVDGVSLSVSAGEFVALYGPSGSGKTTLLMLIAALAASGRVARCSSNGRDVSALTDTEAARYRLHELGFVRQSLNLIPGANALDNAALKLMGTDIGSRAARRAVEPLLGRLGLDERVAHRAEQLSMGERQRVMIARALSTDPKLVLADEPTGSLDTERGRQVLDLFAEICRERHVAVVLVTHDPHAASFADRVYALRDGRLVEHEPDQAFVPASTTRVPIAGVDDEAVEHSAALPRSSARAARAGAVRRARASRSAWPCCSPRRSPTPASTAPCSSLNNGIVGGQMRFPADDAGQRRLRRTAARSRSADSPACSAAAPVLEQNANVSGRRDSGRSISSAPIRGLRAWAGRSCGASTHLSSAKRTRLHAPCSDRADARRGLDWGGSGSRSGRGTVSALLVPELLARGSAALAESPIALAPLRTSSELRA